MRHNLSAAFRCRWGENEIDLVAVWHVDKIWFLMKLIQAPYILHIMQGDIPGSWSWARPLVQIGQ